MFMSRLRRIILELVIDDFDAFFCFSSEKFLNVFCFNVGLREWNGFAGGMTMRAGERR